MTTISKLFFMGALCAHTTQASLRGGRHLDVWGSFSNFPSSTSSTSGSSANSAWEAFSSTPQTAVGGNGWDSWFGAFQDQGNSNTNTNTDTDTADSNNIDITEAEWRACATSMNNAGVWPTLMSFFESSSNGVSAPTYAEALAMPLHSSSSTAGSLWDSNIQAAPPLSITSFLSSLPRVFSVQVVGECKRVNANDGELAAMRDRAGQNGESESEFEFDDVMATKGFTNINLCGYPGQCSLICCQFCPGGKCPEWNNPTPYPVPTPVYVKFESKWKNVGRETRSQTVSKELCSEQTESNSFTEALTESLEVTASVSVSFFGSGEASLEVTKGLETSEEWSNEVSNTLSQCSSTETSIECEQGAHCDATQFVYQFHTVGFRSDGVQREVDSCRFACVDSNIPAPDQQPKCPYLYCDQFQGCQCCNSNAWAVEAARDQVPVCQAACFGGGSLTQCYQMVADQQFCAGEGAGGLDCIEASCSGCADPAAAGASGASARSASVSVAERKAYFFAHLQNLSFAQRAYLTAIVNASS